MNHHTGDPRPYVRLRQEIRYAFLSSSIQCVILPTDDPQEEGFINMSQVEEQVQLRYALTPPARTSVNDEAEA